MSGKGETEQGGTTEVEKIETRGRSSEIPPNSCRHSEVFTSTTAVGF
jgi:hypothetical protein